MKNDISPAKLTKSGKRMFRGGLVWLGAVLAVGLLWPVLAISVIPVAGQSPTPVATPEISDREDVTEDDDAVDEGAGVDEPAPVGIGESETAIQTHVVVAGESLSVIAERYGVPMSLLMAENNISDADAIRIGDRLRIPFGARPVVRVDADFVPEDEPAFHVVLPGESLLGISLRYGVSTAELMEWNGITNPDLLGMGRRLRLSPSPATEPATEPDTEPVTEPGEETGGDVPVEDTVLPDESDTDESDTDESDTDEADGDEEEAGEAGDEAGEETEAAAVPVDPLTAISSLNRRVRVGAGDTVGRIALRHGVNEDALRRINGLGRGQALTLDQELVLPATRQELQAARPASVPVADTRTYHEVQRGESLGVIAQAYGLTLADLLAANRISDPNSILIGQQLIVPEPTVEGEESEEAAGPLQLGRPQRGYFFYTVQAGDTLSQLAREFNTTFLAILEYNNLPDAETVYRGVDLRIPFGPPPQPVTLPPSPQSGTRFMVSLSRQQCWVLQGDRVVHEWICSTGYGEWITRTGVFAVQTKLEMAKSNYYELDMPYWLGIYDVGAAENGIHGLPIEWATGQQIWEGLLGQPATFGCAMLADEDAILLFDLAYLGMPVYIVN